MKTITYNDVPRNYTLCFNGACPMRETCLRYLSAQLLPESEAVRQCVMPSQLKDGRCEWYRENRTVQVAYGFSSVFNKVYAKDASLLRSLFTAFFHGKRQYYWYLKGERPLYEYHKQGMNQIIHNRGYDWNITFDRMDEIIDF